MWRQVEEKYDLINCIGCSAHGFNLIISDIVKIDVIKNVIRFAQAIVKEIRDSPLRLAKYRESDDATELKYAVKT
ncbi:uncharacterized protein B4U79_19240, partial [Dinothrombium tinctorium]